jgi:hypothetical protein
VAAERHFDCVVPQWVKDRNNVWLNYSYDGTGFGYTGRGNGWATTPSGMIQLSLDGFETSDSRWRTAENWLANNWNTFMTQELNRLINAGATTNPANIQWHHVVEQWGTNVTQFGSRAINSLANVVPTPTAVHRAISRFYSSAPQWVRAAGLSGVRDWMATQSWEAQYRYGVEIWKQAMRGGPINWTP